MEETQMRIQSLRSLRSSSDSRCSFRESGAGQVPSTRGAGSTPAVHEEPQIAQLKAEWAKAQGQLAAQQEERIQRKIGELEAQK
eukprot:13221806-Alexandrium_andersonii.AAC.1